jgi:scyllo-inositol 2-dehydrogenase (NADP+)
MIRIGIVGFGKATVRIHLPLLKMLPQYRITAVMSSKPEGEIRNVLGGIEVFDDIDLFASHKCYDLAIVVTPTHTHFPLAKRLLNAGKHVVVEKPFVCNTSEAEELMEIARRRKVLLSVFHNRRWDSDFLTLKRLIAENRIGDIKYFESRFDKYRPRVLGFWREQDLPGAGLLYDIGSHLIDQILILFGKPVSVFATLRKQRPDALVTDAYMIIFKYANFDAVLRTSSLSADSPFRFYVEGSKGSFLKKYTDCQDQLLVDLPPDTLYTGLKEPFDRYGTLANENGSMKVESEVGDYREFYLDIYQSITTGRAPAVTARQAADVIQMIERAHRSHQENQVIEL